MPDFATVAKSMSIEISYLETDNRWIAHKLWRRIDDQKMRGSHLQNQFALAEYNLSPQDAATYFRIWIWEEMQDEYNVVWRELSELANAYEQGREVELRVPMGQLHGEVICNAIEWMVENTTEVQLPHIRHQPARSLSTDISDGVLGVSSGANERRIVWVQGKTQSKLGVMPEPNQVLVPGYGELWVNHPRPANPGIAGSEPVQQALGELLDESLEREFACNPVRYQAAPSTTASESEMGIGTRLVADFEEMEGGIDEDEEIMGLLEESEAFGRPNLFPERYYKRPLPYLNGQEEYIRPVYFTSRPRLFFTHPYAGGYEAWEVVPAMLPRKRLRNIYGCIADPQWKILRIRWSSKMPCHPIYANGAGRNKLPTGAHSHKKPHPDLLDVATLQPGTRTKNQNGMSNSPANGRLL